MAGASTDAPAVTSDGSAGAGSAPGPVAGGEDPAVVSATPAGAARPARSESPSPVSSQIPSPASSTRTTATSAHMPHGGRGRRCSAYAETSGAAVGTSSANRGNRGAVGTAGRSAVPVRQPTSERTPGSLGARPMGWPQLVQKRPTPSSWPQLTQCFI